MPARLKIRGIYATALTKIFLDAGYTIVDPSAEIQGRFDLPASQTWPEVLIRDRQQLQGVELIGEADQITVLVGLLQDRLLDAVRLSFGAPLAAEQIGAEEMQREEVKDLAKACLEFGGDSKKTLDGVRAAVLPTLAGHHRLRIIRPKSLEEAEARLLENAASKEELERELFQEAILMPLFKSGTAALEHIKARAKPLHLRDGVLLHVDERRMLLKRSLSPGRYDGLDLPIEEGDFALTEVEEGAWYLKHAYYSRKGMLKGEYYNVNTPVEFYDTGARYIDLEVDVVRREGEEPYLIDRERLALLSSSGQISSRLERKALEVAESLMKNPPAPLFPEPLR